MMMRTIRDTGDGGGGERGDGERGEGRGGERGGRGEYFCILVPIWVFRATCTLYQGCACVLNAMMRPNKAVIIISFYY